MSESEIEANLRRAEQSVEAARLLLAQGYPDFAASRAYYAAFYAATAALLHEGFAFGTHGSVLSSFHREFVKTGKMDIKYGKNLNRLYELRNVGDYGETRHVPIHEADHATTDAETFVETVKKLLGRS